MPSRKKEIDKLQRELQQNRILRAIEELWKQKPQVSLSEILPLKNLSDKEVEKLLNKKIKGNEDAYS